MRMHIIAGLCCILLSVQAQAQFDVTGKLIDENGTAVEGANVVIEELNKGDISNADGVFEIRSVPAGTYQFTVSFLGYETIQERIKIEGNADLGIHELRQRTFLGEEVTISSVRAGEKTPVAYTDISKEEIKEKNTARDIPILLNNIPSIITSSDAGHGIGYTSMRIRGSDANRINVTINGVPLNDAESQGVFWVDLPELVSSAEQIQVQRGVGTSTNGAGAFGASVNIQTKLLEKEPYFTYETTVGSFNTFRNSLSGGSGMIKDKVAVDFRLSDIKSDGYIDRSFTDLQSYYFSAGWYEESSSLKFITFGGYEELYQSWGGVPSELLKTDRTYNPMGIYTDSAGQTAFYDNQIDHYDQFHYQLHYNKAFSRKVFLNAALHYTHGIGYYEEYKENEEYARYNMKLPVIGNDTAYQTDLVRRKWLDNDFYGFIGSFRIENINSSLIVGGGWNRYIGDHYGKVIWAEYFGDNMIGHQWYEGVGDKYDWNIYGKYYQYLNDKITAFADLQLRSVKHIIEGSDSDNRDITQDHNYTFFNPKAGLNIEPKEGHRAFLSYARANREPNRNNYTDAPTDNPPLPERLDDFEAGYFIHNRNYAFGVTLYYMDYYNQLVLTGELNDVGYPMMTNVEESYRAGAEFEAKLNLLDKLLVNANFTFSKNEIRNFTNYIDNWDYWSDPGNEPLQISNEIGNSTLAYAPSFIGSNQIDYLIDGGFKFRFSSKYVSKQYIDNTSNEKYLIDPYFVNDLWFIYALHPSWAKEVSINIGVINIFDARYETNAWVYRYYEGGNEYHIDGYYPQALRHLMVTLRADF